MRRKLFPCAYNSEDRSDVTCWVWLFLFLLLYHNTAKVALSERGGSC